MERTIFDTHAHYTSHAFAESREELLGALPQQGVALVMDCATDHDTSLASIQLAEQYDFVYAAVGIHPQSLIEDDASTQTKFGGDWRAEFAAMEKLYDHPKVKAVGECGLDHHWPVPKQAQLELFEAQLQFARERELPVIIHDRQAHAEMYELLRRYKPKGVLHSFSGSAEDVKWLAAQGMYFGFTGVVTFKKANRPLKAAAAVPAGQLLLETDCPYMAPEPFRGQKSNSAMIAYTAAKIAEVRGEDTEELKRRCCENGRTLFGI